MFSKKRAFRATIKNVCGDRKFAIVNWFLLEVVWLQTGNEKVREKK